MKSKIPFIISVLTMFSGVVIAIIFGVNEGFFKDRIAKGLKQNQKIMSIVDVELRDAKISAEKSKNWRYYQRFHFHSTGIGAMSLASLILLSFSLAPFCLRIVGAYMISLGGFLYPYVWLFAAMYGPSMGRHEAKEAFSLFGYMGGVFLLGLFILLYSLVRYPNKLTNDNKAALET